jgi:hypothetical protein
MNVDVELSSSLIERELHVKAPARPFKRGGPRATRRERESER